MFGYNKVILLGNLTRDPELKYSANGNAIGRLRLAVNRAYKTDLGENKEEATFVDVEAWGKQAEIIAKHLKKGHPLFMEGRLKLDQWDDKQTGQKKSALRVTLEAFQFIGGATSANENQKKVAKVEAKPAKPVVESVVEVEDSSDTYEDSEDPLL